jgi:cyclopropane-fatty-acyl-phospholipid synthase
VSFAALITLIGAVAFRFAVLPRVLGLGGDGHADLAGAEQVGFETRDLESLREHYALTLRAWLTRLQRHAAEAIALTDVRTYRTWRFYMAGSAFGFSSGRLNIVQTLFAKPDADGRSHLPLRRAHMIEP